MTAAPLVLGFDTSGPHCAVAVLRGAEVLATRLEPMAKGQAERLMPLIEETLAAADTGLDALDAIGVGVGPGNFTGIRISVSAARGLALALGVPAVGVSTFDAFFGRRTDDLRSLIALPAPRGAAYVAGRGPDPTAPRMVVSADDLPEFDLLVAQDREALPPWLGERAKTFAVAAPLAPSIARLAGSRLGIPQPRPAPLYIKPADAAPSREQGPVIL